MGFTITTSIRWEVTEIPNQFIDTYMPHANGSFVKVYLYLLRHMTSHTSDMTIAGIADILENTENDILRALHYWESQGILTVTENAGEITGIELLPLRASEPSMVTSPDVIDKKPEPETISALETAPTEEIEIPEMQTYTPLQAEALKRDKDIESALSIVEALLGTTLSDSHMQLILYFMTDLGFSLELVITLYETALARGTSSSRYIEAVGIDWAKKGIRTSKEAEDEASSFNGTYRIVSNALGIKRPLAPAEKKIIDTWNTYQFTPAILEEACNRTVLQSGDTNLNYTTKILKDWHEKGVTSLKDIEECDQSFFRQKKAAETSSQNKVTPIHKNKFQNFPQRDYSQSECNDLEKQLLRQ